MAATDRIAKPLSQREIERREEQRRQELLSRDDVEHDYKGITRRWLELAALSGNGPPMIKISARMVRYQRGVFEDWINARTVKSTSEQLSAAA